jgi:hypothetical protein
VQWKPPPLPTVDVFFVLHQYDFYIKKTTYVRRQNNTRVTSSAREHNTSTTSTSIAEHNKAWGISEQNTVSSTSISEHKTSISENNTSIKTLFNISLSTSTSTSVQQSSESNGTTSTSTNSSVTAQQQSAGLGEGRASGVMLIGWLVEAGVPADVAEKHLIKYLNVDSQSTRESVQFHLFMDQFLMMQNFLLLRKLQVDFAKQDRDQNGQLDREEWKAFLTLAFGPEQAALESEILFTQCDEDGSGQLSLQEVYDWLQNRMQNAATRRERQNAPPRPPIEKVPTAPPPLPRSVQ